MAESGAQFEFKEITKKDMDGEGDDRFNRNARGPSLPVEYLREMLSF